MVPLNVSFNLSIIYPNFDLKYSHVIENIEKWLNLKTNNNTQYELIVISRPIPKEELDMIRKQLGNRGSILTIEQKGERTAIWQSDNLFWNIGAELSKYENLLFVEGHVFPDEDFLLELSSYITRNKNIKVLNFNPPNSKNSHIERVLDNWYTDTIQRRKEIHNFNFLSRQAFLFKKETFNKFGPLRIEFEQFAPPFLSSVLAENLISIETVDFTNLTHILEDKIENFIPPTRSYIRGYSIAEKQIDKDYLTKYFGKNFEFEKIKKRELIDRNKKEKFIHLKNRIRYANRVLILGASSFLIKHNKVSNRINSNLINKIHKLVTVDEYESNRRGN
jgi:hypothetical protein